MTSNHIKEYWLNNHKTQEVSTWLPVMVACRAVTCADGFVMSVQASQMHYSQPRQYLESGNYTAWEVGFPSEKEELLMEYVEDPDNPTGTVYGYVPTKVINAVIEKHGGII